MEDHQDSRPVFCVRNFPFARLSSVQYSTVQYSTVRGPNQIGRLPSAQAPVPSAQCPPSTSCFPASLLPPPEQQHHPQIFPSLPFQTDHHSTTPAPLRNSNSNHQPTSFLTPLTPTLHDCTFRLSVLIPFYLCLRPSRLSSCLPRNSFRLPTLPSYLCCSSARNVSSFNYSFAPFPVDISLIPSLSTPPRHPSIHCTRFVARHVLDATCNSYPSCTDCCAARCTVRLLG